MADTGYVSRANSGNYAHTTAQKLFYHDGAWWAIMHTGNNDNWNIHKWDGTFPASPGDTGGWTANTSVGTAVNFGWLGIDLANDTVYVMTGSASSTKPRMHVFSYNSGTGNWSHDTGPIVMSNSGSTSVGIQLATPAGGKTPFSNNDHLSILVDTNGVPYIFAGNAGTGTSASTGVHFAYPTDTANLWTQPWAYHTIGTDTPAHDYAGSFINEIIVQNGTNRIAVIYMENNSGTMLIKAATHDIETTMSNYTSGWNIETLNSGSFTPDDHLCPFHGSYGGKDYIGIACKTAGDDCYVVLAQLDAGANTFTVQTDYVTHLNDNISRPTACIDETNGKLIVAFQEDVSSPKGSIYYKTSDLGVLAFDDSDLMAVTATKIIDDESQNDANNPHLPIHPVTNAMAGYMPIICDMDGATAAQWWNAIEVAAAGGAVNLTASIGDATADGNAATVKTGHSLTAGVGNAVADGFAPGETIGVSLVAGIGDAVADGNAGTISAGVSLVAGIGDAVADGNAAEFSGDLGQAVNLTAGIGNAVADGFAPIQKAGVSLVAGIGDAVADGFAPGDVTGVSVSAQMGNAIADGNAATVTAGVSLTAGIGDAIADGYPATFVSSGNPSPPGRTVTPARLRVVMPRRDRTVSAARQRTITPKIAA